MPQTNFLDAREPLPEPSLHSEAVAYCYLHNGHTFYALRFLCEFCGKPADNWPGDIGQLCQMCWEAECARTWGLPSDKLGVLVEPDLDGPGSYLVALL